MWYRLADVLAGGSTAYAMSRVGGGNGGQPGFLLQMAPFFLVFAIIYFLMIRPHQKRQQEHQQMLGALRAGDNVLAGGIYGEIVKIKDDVVTLKVADNVRIRVHRTAITNKFSPGGEQGTSVEGTKAASEDKSKS